MNNIKYGQDVRQAIKRGVDALANAVRVTLGPKGRNVIIDRPGRPVVTKDGVSVAKAVNVSDPFEQLGVRLVREAASKTADEAGDGTTTATVLAQALYSEGLEAINNGQDPTQLKRGLDSALEESLQILDGMAKPVASIEDLVGVATVSANGDEKLGRLIAQAVNKVGKDGAVTVIKSPTSETLLDMGEGLKVDGGFASHYFVTNPEKNEAVLEEPYILIYKDPIHSFKSLMPILQQVIDKEKSLLIVAEQVEGEALTNLLLNKLQGRVKAAVAKAPAYGEQRAGVMQDLVTAVGASNVGSRDLVPLEKLTLDQLGRAARVILGPTSLTIVEGKGDPTKVKAHIEGLKQLKQDASGMDKIHLNDRISRLSGGIAVVRVGAESEVELKEKMDRVEDAIGATMAALDGGTVPGGGQALSVAAKLLKAESKPAQILVTAMQAPAEQIQHNAGSPFSIADEIRDPLKVTKRALANAVSVVGTMLTTEVIVGQPEQSNG